jgi:DNA mismatch repair protein MutS2
MKRPSETPPPTGVLAFPDAGTPFALPDRQLGQALDAIEFDAALGLVAARAAGSLGAARIRSRRPSAELVWIRDELARVAQAAQLIRTGNGISAEAAPDIRPLFDRLRVPGTMLEGPALVTVRQVLAASRLVLAELRRATEDAPLVAQLAAPPMDRSIEPRLQSALDGDGEVQDGASPALAAARNRVRTSRERLIRRLEAMLRELGAGAEATVTVRGGRYVIPVARDARNRPAGIVHDESASGATLFVEPTQTIELGNALRSAEVEVEREVLKVLQELTELIRPHRDSLAASLEMCVAVDDLVARAKYSVDVDGFAPTMNPAPAPLTVWHARHPLLLAQREAADRDHPVVPFDLMLDPGERTLLLTGPNTGGKTVLLKAVGVIAALAQSGIIPPIGPGGALPVFGGFFVDIGDRQSIAASLSTFSAHVAELRRILAEADDTSLVLIDEIGSGTDPAEGGALAAASLRALTARRTLTFATTHLGGLKALATETAGIVNASLQFNTTTLEPTYRLEKGVPGRSFGLAIARRLGIAPAVLAEAEAEASPDDHRLDSLLAQAEERSRDLEARIGQVEAQRAELAALTQRVETQAAAQRLKEKELADRERTAEHSAREQTKAYLLEARKRVEQAISQARAAVDEVTAREARRLVEEGIRAEAEALAQETVVEPSEASEDVGSTGLNVGSRVRLSSGARGRVEEVRADGKLVVVAGAVKLVVDRSEVVATGEVARARKPASTSVSEPTPSSASAPSELDLRGLTADEAEGAVIAAIDAAVLAERPFLRIIHGKGTGALRVRVQQVVANDKRIAKFGFASTREGGTGVTVLAFEP